MAAIDKMNEFYTCAKRFAFLAQRDTYRPTADDLEIPEGIQESMDEVCSFFTNNPEFLKQLEEAEEWFEKMHEQLEMIRRQELLSFIVKECCR
jgi:hypothetical protein